MHKYVLILIFILILYRFSNVFFNGYAALDEQRGRLNISLGVEHDGITPISQ